MYKYALRLIVGVTLIFFLFSCEGGSILLDRKVDESNFPIKTLVEGSILLPGSVIPVVIESSSEIGLYGSLVVNLLSVDGDLIGTRTYSPSDLASAQTGDVPLSGIPFPELPKDRYFLELILSDQSGVETSRKRIEVFGMTGALEILRMNSFPPSLYPGSSAILQVDFVSPDSDPVYLRWSMGGRLLASGMSNDGYSSIEWKSPDTQGIYTVRVEAFPFAPENGDFPFLSPVMYESEIFVSTALTPGRYDFVPESSYGTLYHFRGNMMNSGYSKTEDVLERNELVNLAISDGLFGYHFSGGTSFASSRSSIIPVVDGILQPFTVRMLINLDSEDSLDGTLVKSGSPAGNHEFIWELRNGLPFFTLKAGETSYELAADNLILPVGENVLLSFTCIPQRDGTIDTAWYYEGKAVSRDTFLINPATIDFSGLSETVFGGSGNLSVLFDEFGIYSKDERGIPNSYDRFDYDVMSTETSNGIVFLYGFEGAAPFWAVKDDSTAFLRNGMLNVLPETELVLKTLSLPVGSYVLSADIVDGHVSLVETTGKSVLDLTSDTIMISSIEKTLEFTGKAVLTVRDESLFLDYGAESYYIMKWDSKTEVSFVVHAEVDHTARLESLILEKKLQK